MSFYKTSKVFALCTLISFQKIILPSLKTNAFPEVSLLKEIKVLMCDVIFRYFAIFFMMTGERQQCNNKIEAVVDEKCNAGK